jgi:predicted PurR-regulated permease PerM
MVSFKIGEAGLTTWIVMLPGPNGRVIYIGDRMQNKRPYRRVTTPRIMLWTAGVAIVLLGFAFLWLIQNVLFLIFVSLLVATGIEPLVNKLRAKGPFSRSTGILFVYSIIFGTLALVIYLAVPPLIAEGQRLAAAFGDPQKIKASISSIDNSFLRDTLTTAYENAGSILQSVAFNSQTLNIGLSLFEIVFSTATVFVIAFYWLTEKLHIKRFIFSLVPRDKRAQSNTVWENVETRLGAWMRGQLVLMLFIGVLAGVGYTIMGLKFAFALAVFAGLAELIPIIGPFLGGAPAVLIALTQDLTTTIIVVIYIVILQLVEGNVLVPRIMEKAVGVSPLTVIIGILIGSTIAGIGGALLAVPVAAAVQVLVNNLLSYNSETNNSVDAAASINTGKGLELAAKAEEQKTRGGPAEL